MRPRASSNGGTRRPGHVWRLTVSIGVSIAGVILIGMSVVVGAFGGQYLALSAVAWALAGLGGMVAGFRQLLKVRAIPEATSLPTSRSRLLVIGVGFSAAGIYLLTLAAGDFRSGSALLGVASFLVGLGGLGLGVLGILAGLGTPLPRRRR